MESTFVVPLPGSEELAFDPEEAADEDALLLEEPATDELPLPEAGWFA